MSEGCGHPTYLTEEPTINEEAPHVSEGRFTQGMGSCEFRCLGDAPPTYVGGLGWNPGLFARLFG